MQWNCTFLETSAKMAINVQELFDMLPNHDRKPATCLHHPQKKPQMSKTVEKGLSKCIIM